MKRERKKRLLHELGFTAQEVQIIEELAAKRGVLAPDFLRSAISLQSRWDLGQVVVMTPERYETLSKKGETTKGD
jgi:hypothetical protein